MHLTKGFTRYVGPDLGDKPALGSDTPPDWDSPYPAPFTTNVMVLGDARALAPARGVIATCKTPDQTEVTCPVYAYVHGVGTWVELGSMTLKPGELTVLEFDAPRGTVTLGAYPDDPVGAPDGDYVFAFEILT